MVVITDDNYTLTRLRRRLLRSRELVAAAARQRPRAADEVAARGQLRSHRFAGAAKLDHATRLNHVHSARHAVWRAAATAAAVAT